MVNGDHGAFPSNPRVGDVVVMDLGGLDELIVRLGELGFETRGPTVREGAIAPGPVGGVVDLPAGVRDSQAPGRYRLEHAGDGLLFGWAVGSSSWKPEFFPPSQLEWRAEVVDDTLRFHEPSPRRGATAIIGARPCEVAAMEVLDRVLANGAHRDPRYADSRDGVFVVAAECTTPGGTCFCTSMATGPAIEAGFDLALVEVDDSGGHRFVMRVGTTRGAEVLSGLTYVVAADADVAARERVLEESAARMLRHVETEGLPGLLARNLENPRWDRVAERCLSCANCTLVCPTCFCSDVRDTTDVSGALERRRTWSSCFDLDHSYLHGGPVRASTSSRYRQWMTHKLSTWWDQFDTSGCVGCGRCITWCPVGIDITEEAASLRATDGATRGERRVEGSTA